MAPSRRDRGPRPIGGSRRHEERLPGSTVERWGHGPPDRLLERLVGANGRERGSVVVTVAGWAARLVIALVFVAAAVGKVRDPVGTRQSSRDLGVPERSAGRTARALPIVEAAIAALVLVPATHRIGAAFAVVLLAIFSAAIARTLRTGRRPACRCFGAVSAGPIGSDTLVRNGALIVLAVVALVAAP